MVFQSGSESNIRDLLKIISINQSINWPIQMKLQFYILTWDGTSVWRRSYIHHTRIFDPGEPSPYAAGDHTIKINVKKKHPPPPPRPETLFFVADYSEIRISDFKCWDELLCHEKDLFLQTTGHFIVSEAVFIRWGNFLKSLEWGLLNFFNGILNSALRKNMRKSQTPTLNIKSTW